MEIEFKTRIDKQIQASEYWIDDTTEEILYGGAKGGGKSYLGASLIFGSALLYPKTHYFIARQELVDLRKFTVPTINEVFQNLKVDITQYAKYNGQDNTFTLYNGAIVFLIACKELPSDPLYERFGSMQMTGGWIEEGGEVSERAKANLWLSVGRWKNKEYNLKKKLLVTANPKKGWMKREFVDPFNKGKLPKTRKYIQAFATDNLYLPKDYLETLKAEKDNVTRQRLWEGNWDYDEDQDSLTSYDALSDAFSTAPDKDGKKYMTVDVARLGVDKTVFSYWDGLELYKVDKFEKQSISETIQKIKDKAAEEKIPFSKIIVDEDGVGGGVVDGLMGVKGFVANSRAIPTKEEVRMKQAKMRGELTPRTNFANLKSQCAWKLAELLNEHKIAFATPILRDEIIEELSALLRKKDVDSDGKLQIKPKKEVKEDIGRSPDIGDTLVFRAWFELKADAFEEDPNKEKSIKLQQNNFAKNRQNFKNNSTK